MARWEIDFDYNVDTRDSRLLEYMVRAEAHRQLTSKIPIPPTMAKRIDRINIVRQIKGTTGLEGNPLTEDEIGAIVNTMDQNLEQKEKHPLGVHDQEIHNAYEVQRFVRRRAREANSELVSEGFIRELHRLSTQNIESDRNIPGVYRNSPVQAGDYIPPDPNYIPTLMKEFVEMINNRKLTEGYTALIRAFVAHFFLISIHPFGDGNGRTARALEAYILYQAGYNTRGFYSVANFFYRNRQEYIRQLDRARFEYNGNLTEFTKFALSGFVDEINGVQNEILGFIRKELFISYAEEVYRKGDINARCFSILDFITRYGELNMKMFKDRKHPLIEGLYQNIKTFKTIKRDLEMLQRAALVIVGEGGFLEANIDIMDQFEA